MNNLMNKNKKYLLLIISIYFLLTGLSYSQVSSLNICLSRDSTNFYDSVGFPMVGMGDGVVFGPEDWTYENPKLTMYLLVTGTQPFFASDLIINFDSSKTKLSVLPGNLFANYFMDTISIGLGSIRINIASLASNVMPQPNKYLIKLLVKILKPGYSNLKIQNSDFRYFDEINNVSINVPTNIFNGAIKFYLGDFAHSRTEINRGDGDVNFKDASVFFQHYGSSEGDGIYERKFDISGGCCNFDYYTLPSTDGSINFYDLIMFVMGYEREGSGLLMRMNSKLPQSLEGFKVDISSYNQNGNVIEVPLKFLKGSSFIKSISIGIIFDNKIISYTGFTNNLRNENSIVIPRSQGTMIYIDIASLGAGNSINSDGVIFSKILFKRISSGDISKILRITSCDILTTNNELYSIKNN